MTRRKFQARIDASETAARAFLVMAFRASVFVIFAPIAWACFAKGETIAGFVFAGLALGLGSVLAPHD